MSFTIISHCLAYFDMPSDIINAVARYVCSEKWCLQRDSNGKLYRVFNPAYFMELSNICLSKYDALTLCSVVLNTYYKYDSATSLVQRRRLCDNGDVEIILYISINIGIDVYRYIYIVYTMSSSGECTFVKGSFHSNRSYIPLDVDRFRIENRVLFIVYGYSQLVYQSTNLIRPGSPPTPVHDSISNIIDSMNPDEYVENYGYEVEY